MYKLSVSQAIVLFTTPQEADSSYEAMLVESFSQLSITKLFQNLQFTKRLNIISDNIDQLFGQFCNSMPMIEAGGGVVSNPKGEILMIYRNGMWDLPKGKLEKGERIEECAVREVEEECGLSGVVGGEFISHTFHCYQLNGDWVLKRTSWYKMSYSNPSSPTPQIEEGITRVEWTNNIDLELRLNNSYYTIHDLFATMAHK